MTYTELHSAITQDLDENILCDISKQIPTSGNAKGYTETTIIFTNPITDQPCKIAIEQYQDGIIQIFYAQDLQIGKFEEWCYVHDLQDLYNMILIDDEDGQ